MTMRSVSEIEAYLTAFRGAAARPLGINVIPREKTRSGLADLGLTLSAAQQVIFAVSAKDYCKGPEVNHNNPEQSVWIFGKEVAGVEVYIKLILTPRLNQAICIAFHPAERRLFYPHRSKTHARQTSGELYAV